MLDRLPEDVLVRIFSYAVPPASPDAISHRYRRLRSLAFISRTVARAVGRVLYETVDINDEISAVHLCIQASNSKVARFLAFHSTTTLRVDEIRGDYVEQLLKRLPALTELDIRSSSLNVLTLSLTVGVRAPLYSDAQVTLKFLTKCGREDLLPARQSPAPAAHLARLVLNDVVLFDDERKPVPMTKLINPSSMPRLRTLAVTWAEGDAEVSFVAPQLTHLWLSRFILSDSRTSIHPSLPAESFDNLPNLQHFAVDLLLRDDLADIAHLSAALRSVRLDGKNVAEVERFLLSANPPCIRQLALLVVDKVKERDQRWRERTISECQNRGVVLEEDDFKAHPDQHHADVRWWAQYTQAA
ncbi:hypothetical protein JCM10020v2_006744 [Rhodotorula toruloides]